MLEHLVNAAARFDGTSDGKVAVPLQKHAPGQAGNLRFTQEGGHARDFRERGFDEPAVRGRLREAALDIRRKAREPARGVLNVRAGIGDGCKRLLRRAQVRAEPNALLRCRDLPDDGVARKHIARIHFCFSSCRLSKISVAIRRAARSLWRHIIQI